MILLDVVELVEIINHEAMRLLEGLLGEVGKKVDPLEARPVAEMEAGNRIEGGAGAGAR